MDITHQSDSSMIGKWPDPISFLEDYIKFAANARPLLIQVIIENHGKATEDDEKKLLLQLGMEQFFFLWETFLAFYGAETSERQVDLYYWLTEDFCKLNEATKQVEEKELRILYESIFTELNKKEIEEFIHHSLECAKWIKTLSPVTESLLPVFNRSKHKFLFYRHNDEICSLVSKECEERLLKFAAKSDNEKTLSQDISWLAKLAKTTRILIHNSIYVVIARLQKEGQNRWLSGPGKNAELITLRP